MKLISTNPSKNYEVIGEVEISTEQDIRDAVTRAREAQLKWAKLSLKERCAYIQTFIDVSKNKKEEIAQIIAEETGRRIVEARLNVVGGIEYLERYIEMAEKILSPYVTHETNTEVHRVYREPRGVIAVICPWNYPFMNVAWQCGQALIAGNTIVYKNSEENPLFAKFLEKIIAECNWPEGVFNVIYGDGKVGDMLVHQDIDMISFTGSTQTGQYLTKVAAEKFIPIVTELGGSSPGIIFEDSDLNDEVIDFIYGRRFVNAGQICTSVKRLIVHESKFNEVVEKLCETIKSKKVGSALDEDTDIGPLVAKRQLELLEEQVADAIAKGAKVEIGGKRPENLEEGYYLPTILTNISFDMRVWKEETFGPVLPIVQFTTEEEAIRLANDTQYGLGAHVIINDNQQFMRVAKKIQSGMVAQNKINYLHPHNPFGGYKHSGMGRLHGEVGFHEVTQIKLISEEK